MTRDDMLDRVKQLGGLNAKTALIVSIEKWKSLHEHLGEMVRMPDDSEHVPTSYNCALCEFYKPTKDSCNGCPLTEKGSKRGCSDQSDWYFADTAILTNDYYGFQTACERLVTRMQEALEEIQ